jgi:hypothetical protein
MTNTQVEEVKFIAFKVGTTLEKSQASHIRDRVIKGYPWYASTFKAQKIRCLLLTIDNPRFFITYEDALLSEKILNLANPLKISA